MISIDRIREGVPLAAVFPETSAEGVCPFCRGERFLLHPQGHLYHCPDCGEKGDVITATMRLDGLTFREAVTRLQARVNGD